MGDRCTGRLKSLQQYTIANHPTHSLRFNADLPSLTTAKATDNNGKETPYNLLSLPLYLVQQLERLLEESLSAEVEAIHTY